MKTSGSKVKIVISVLEGRYFSKSYGSSSTKRIYVQCNFQHQILLTEPVELTNQPIWETQLVWEIDPKLLHYLKTQRATMKLLVYSIDLSNKRETVGYIILDLRNISRPPWKDQWFPLINTKSVLRPELKLNYGIITSEDEANTNVSAKEPKQNTTSHSGVGRLFKSVHITQIDRDEYLLDSDGSVAYQLQFSILSLENLRLLMEGFANEGGFVGDSVFNVSFSFLDSFFVFPDFQSLEETLAATQEKFFVTIYANDESFRNFLIELDHVDFVITQNHDRILGVAEWSTAKLISDLKVLVREGVSEKHFECSCKIANRNSEVFVDVNGNAPAMNMGLTLERQISARKEFSQLKTQTAITEVEKIIGQPKMVNMHQYRYSIEVRSVHNVHVSATNVFFKYSYPAFGSVNPVISHPHIQITRSQQSVIPNSFCGFEFIMSEQTLLGYLSDIPLVVEMWQSTGNNRDQQIGGATLKMTDVFQDEKDGGKAKSKKIKNAIVWTADEFVQVIAMDPSGQTIKICDARVILSLEDFGAVPGFTKPSKEPKLVYESSKVERILPPEPKSQESFKKTNPNTVETKPVASQQPKQSTLNPPIVSNPLNLMGHEKSSNIPASNTVNPEKKPQIPSFPTKINNPTESDFPKFDNNPPNLSQPIPLQHSNAFSGVASFDLSPPVPVISAIPSIPSMNYNNNVGSYQTNPIPTSSQSIVAPPPAPLNEAKIRQEIQQQVVQQFNDWKMQEEVKFKSQLKDKEDLLLHQLAEEWKKKENEREALIQRKMDDFKRLQDKFKQSLKELENREKKLEADESDLLKSKLELEKDKQSGVTLIKDSARRIQDEYQHKLDVEKAKVKEIESQRNAARSDYQKSLENYKQLEEEFRLYRLAQQSSSVNQLQDQVHQLKGQILGLEQKLASANKSKRYYKLEWAKTIQELTAIREKQHIEIRDLIDKEKADLGKMQDNLYKNQVSAQSLSEALAGLRTSQKGVGEVPVPGPEDKLVKERDFLLASGAYVEKDDLILYLNSEIESLSRKK